MSERWRLHLVLFGVALVLAVLLAWDLSRDRPAGRVARALVPELGDAAILAVTIEGQDGAVRLERGRAGAPFTMTRPTSAPVSEAAVRDLLSAIELLSFRRREQEPPAGGAIGLDPPRATLRIEFGDGSRVVLFIGDEIESARGAWVRREDRDELFFVEAHAARDLDRSAADLRERYPFRAHGRAGAVITVGGADPVRVTGGPLARVFGHPQGGVSVSIEANRALLRALGELHLTRFVAAPEKSVPAPVLISVVHEAQKEELRDLGPCPDAPEERLVATSIGVGCVVAEALTRAVEAGSREELVERGLFRELPERVEVERVESEPFAIAVDVSAEAAVRAWLEDAAAILAEAELAPVDELGAEVGSIKALFPEQGAARLAIRQAGDRHVALVREGEGLGLRVGMAALAVLLPPAHRFLDLELIARDPYDLLAATGSRYGRVVERIERGELLDEWRLLAPAGATLDRGAVERLRVAIAPLRANKVVAPRARPIHGLSPAVRAVELRLDPEGEGAEPEILALEIGNSSPGGCYARVRGRAPVYELAVSACTALTGPWHRR